MEMHILNGSNFSGRTEKLRKWVGLPNDDITEPVNNNTAYISPNAINSFSGIAPTVSTEIELMASDMEAERKAKKAFDDLGFGYLLHQNPYTLSSGEQVVAATVAATAARPNKIAVDCAFEPLSPETRTSLLSYLQSLDLDLMIADNRLDEWFLGEGEQLQTKEEAPKLLKNSDIEFSRQPHEIEIIDLCHSYNKGRAVFTNLNLILNPNMTYHVKGQNGAGKTTLSKILCGLIKPTSGKILLDGKSIQPWKNPGSFAAYAFQDPDFQLFKSTVSAQIENIVNQMPLVENFGLQNHLTEHPLDLPNVLRKRLSIATAASRFAKLLILDEPTIGQDNDSAHHFRKILQNRAGLVISHSQIYNELPVIELK